MVGGILFLTRKVEVLGKRINLARVKVINGWFVVFSMPRLLRY